MTVTEPSLPLHKQSKAMWEDFFVFFLISPSSPGQKEMKNFFLFKETHNPSFVVFIKTEGLGLVRPLDQDVYCFLVYLLDLTLEAAMCNSGDLLSRYLQEKFCV